VATRNFLVATFLNGQRVQGEQVAAAAADRNELPPQPATQIIPAMPIIIALVANFLVFPPMPQSFTLVPIHFGVQPVAVVPALK